MNSVRAASASSSALARSVPSTFETKRTRGAPRVSGCSASTAMAGPRSEPPMPMLMTVSNGVPAEPRIVPLRTSVGELQHALALGEHLARDVRAARGVRGSRRHAQRGVQHGAILGGVDGLAGPHRFDARAQARGIGEAGQQAQPVVVDALAGKVEVQPNGFAGESAAACRIAIAKRAQGNGTGFPGARLQGTPCGVQIVLGHRREICWQTGPRWYRQPLKVATLDSTLRQNTAGHQRAAESWVTTANKSALERGATCATGPPRVATMNGTSGLSMDCGRLQSLLAYGSVRHHSSLRSG